MRINTSVVLLAVLANQLAFASARAEKPLSMKQSSFQLVDGAQIPDGTLKPGSYSIRIADHLADRMVVEIKDAEGNAKEKFLAVPAQNVPTSSPIGPITGIGTEKKMALRGFSFVGGPVVEFVYSKNDAVALAKANGGTVLAIDPASEGMPSDTGLNAEDMKMVTLWMLTPTPISASNQKAGIQAARYQPPASAATERAEIRPPVISRLPKTASMLPLLSIVGLSSLVLALILSFFRSREGVI